MAAEEEVVLIARLQGATQVVRGAAEISGSLDEVAVSADEAGLAMERSGRRGFFMNQAFFTMRRLAYGATLAVVGTGIAAARMGFQFNSAMQQARVALQPVSHDIGGVQRELTSLFNFTKYTPFQFKDVTIAFRQMYLGMRTVGISATQVNGILHAMTDALAATGRTTPGTLNRVAVALQHMAYQGHLTGYSVNQLARDGIPIFAALRHELGLTGDQIHNIGTLGVPTQVALRAIQRYIETTPGLMNAAYRQATQSLHGQFTTFKDNISMLFGNMETGVFNRFQDRLTSFNAFFGRISNSMQHHASFADVIGQFAGGTAEFVWKQFASDISLAWRIFSGFISDVARSHATWGIIISALIILHGILLPINFAVQHFGGALDVLLPLLVLWKAYTMTMNMLLGIQRFLIRADAGELGELSLAQMLYNRTIDASFFAMIRLRDARSALNVLLRGTALGNEYRALSTLELAALRLRGAFIALWKPFSTFLIQLVTLDAELWANPVFLIIGAVVLLVATLVILYIKWRAFHNAVNATVSWLWHHPIIGLFVPVLGPLVAMAHAFMAIYHHLRGIYDLLRHPLRAAGGFLHGVEHLGGSLLSHVPFMASGGVINRAGTVVVGEQGPEILTLPQAAQVTPIGGGGGGIGGSQGQREPIQINFMVGQRVLESVIVDIINGRVAHV